MRNPIISTYTERQLFQPPYLEESALTISSSEPDLPTTAVQVRKLVSSTIVEERASWTPA